MAESYNPAGLLPSGTYRFGARALTDPPWRRWDRSSRSVLRELVDARSDPRDRPKRRQCLHRRTRPSQSRARRRQWVRNCNASWSKRPAFSQRGRFDARTSSPPRGEAWFSTCQYRNPELVGCHPELVGCHPELVEGRRANDSRRAPVEYSPTPTRLPLPP